VNNSLRVAASFSANTAAFAHIFGNPISEECIVLVLLENVAATEEARGCNEYFIAYSKF
jgi:hypothetical protein